MKDEEAKKLLDQEIYKCKEEKENQYMETSSRLGISIIISELITCGGASALGASNYTFPLIAGGVAAYTLATVFEPLKFRYSDKEYLKFLKEVRKNIEKESNKYEKVEKADFEKVLRKEFNLKKNS